MYLNAAETDWNWRVIYLHAHECVMDVFVVTAILHTLEKEMF